MKMFLLKVKFRLVSPVLTVRDDIDPQCKTSAHYNLKSVHHTVWNILQCIPSYNPQCRLNILTPPSEKSRK